MQVMKKIKYLVVLFLIALAGCSVAKRPGQRLLNRYRATMVRMIIRDAEQQQQMKAMKEEQDELEDMLERCLERLDQ